MDTEYIDMASADTHRDAWKGMPLQNDDIEYYKRIRTELESGTLEEEDVQMLIENVLEESKGKEYRLSVNRQGSRVLEYIAQQGNITSVITLAERLIPISAAVACDRSGSHVIQTILHRLPTLLGESEYKDKIISVILQISMEFGKDWLGAMEHGHGNFVVRDLCKLLSGIVAFPKESKNAKKRKTPQREIYKPENFDKATNKSFRGILKEMSKAVSDACEEKEQLTYIIQTECLSLSVQELMLALTRRKKTREKQLSELIGALLRFQKPEATSDDELVYEPSKATMSHTNRLVRDRTGSRLMEIIIANAPLSIFLTIGEIMAPTTEAVDQLVGHAIGNFGFQAYLTRLSALFSVENDSLSSKMSKKFMKLSKLYIKHLCTQADFLLFSSRGGVMQRAVHLAGVTGLKQQLVFDSIKDALLAHKDELNVPNENIILSLLQLPQRGQKEQSAYAAIGLSIVIDLLSFAEAGTAHDTMLEQWSQIPQATLLDIAADRTASRLCDAFLDFPTTDKKIKLLTVARFKTHFAALSMSSVGSYVVEKLFANSDENYRRLIAQELEAAYSKLLGNRFGKIVIANLRIAEYKKGYKDWERSNVSKLDPDRFMKKIFGNNDKEPKHKKHKKNE